METTKNLKFPLANTHQVSELYLRGKEVVVVCNVVANLLYALAAVVLVILKKFLNDTAAVGKAVDKVVVIVGTTSGIGF